VCARKNASQSTDGTNIIHWMFMATLSTRGKHMESIDVSHNGVDVSRPMGFINHHWIDLRTTSLEFLVAHLYLDWICD
jgi:hypothetical protein